MGEEIRMDDNGFGPLVIVLVGCSAIGAALVAGVFFAFSAFVMSGLDRSGPRHAVPAMQGINVTALRPPLMLLLFGTLVVSLTATVVVLVDRGWSAVTWLVIAGFAVYALGVVVVTAVGNVPLNNKLMARDDPADADDAWHDFDRPWTRLNHVRASAAALGAVLLTVAMRLG